MMKNFTKILLGLTALATSSANAMEWRTVSNEDFGGNNDGDPIVRTDAPHDKDADDENGFYTPLQFTGQVNPEPGLYMVLKSTGLAESPTHIKLTDCGGSLSCWENFGDHTYPSDPNKGYFMVFDADASSTAVDISSNLLLYKKSLPISCSGVNFKFGAWMASASKWGGNTVQFSIQDDRGTNLVIPFNDDLAAGTVSPGTWKKIEKEFSLGDLGSGKVFFVILATNVNSSGYDLALDDITIEVNQPEIDIKPSTDYQYQKPVTLNANYIKSEFDDFFPGGGTIKYQWYFKKPGETDDKYALVHDGTYTPGGEITYPITAFEKDKHNGTYKLVVASSENLNNNLCSIRDTFVINEDKNKLNVNVCQDSTKKMSDGNIIDTSKPDWDFGSIVYTVKTIPLTTITDRLYQDECKSTAYPVTGENKINDVLTYYTEADLKECPKTKQELWLRVSDIIPDPDTNICKGDRYKSDGNVMKIWNDENETTGGTLIEFSEGGCNHGQRVWVHPTEERDTTIILCKGEKFQGKRYDEVGTNIVGDPIVSETKWHCKKTLTPKITVLEPILKTINEDHCPTDGYTYKGVLYDYPITITFVDTCRHCAPNKADSIITTNLVVHEGGIVNMGDTLICRDQILFGKEYTEAGKDTVYLTGFTESGCSRDTMWIVKITEVSLKLRLYNDQRLICEGQPSTMDVKLNVFDPGGNKLSPTHRWEPEIPQNVLSPTLYPKETTTYSIYADLDIPADARGCHAKESVTITVNPNPTLTIDSVNPEKRTVDYTIEGGTAPYHLYVGKKDLGETEDVEGTLEKQPFGEHTLLVQDYSGCQSEQKFEIKATEPEAMSFFSPNGDGENDRWIIKNIDVYQNATVRIFDRFGKLLIECPSQDFEFGWDGTYNGKHLPATDYWYEIDIEEIDRQYVGHFTLIH